MMKHHLLLTFCFVAASVAAAPAPLAPLTTKEKAALVAHCNCVMNAGVCAIETRRPVAVGPVIYKDRIVQASDANFLTLAGPAMCTAAKRELAKDSTSDRSFVIRQRWRKDFSVCPYPVVTPSRPGRQP